MGHVDGLLLFLDLTGAVDANRDVGHHVAPPCAVFSPSRCRREAAPSAPGGGLVSSRRASILLTLDLLDEAAAEREAVVHYRAGEWRRCVLLPADRRH